MLGRLIAMVVLAGVTFLWQRHVERMRSKRNDDRATAALCSEQRNRQLAHVPTVVVDMTTFGVLPSLQQFKARANRQQQNQQRAS